MTFIPTPHGARIVINWALGTQTYSYVFYATMDGYVFDNQVQLAANIAGAHTGTLRNMFSTGVDYKNTTVYDARELDGPIVVNTVNAGNGGVANEALPINTAVCVTLRTGARGRSARGRKYIAGWAEAAAAGGQWSAGTATNALAYVQAILAQITAAGFTPVIRSIQENGVKLTVANTRAITSSQVRNTQVATQRRRVDRP